MSVDQTLLETLAAKEAIRDLALLYCRGVDRKDGELLRTLYTEDATDTHGDTFDGPAEEYVQFLEQAFPYMRYSGHHICNHLISVDGDRGEGEVYAIAWHVIPDGSDGWMEDIILVRYMDHYRKDADGWRFSQRVVSYDHRIQRPVLNPEKLINPDDIRNDVLLSRLFAPGPRA